MTCISADVKIANIHLNRIGDGKPVFQGISRVAMSLRVLDSPEFSIGWRPLANQDPKKVAIGISGQDCRLICRTGILRIGLQIVNGGHLAGGIRLRFQ
jgi:hypothetical protein